MHQLTLQSKTFQGNLLPAWFGYWGDLSCVFLVWDFVLILNSFRRYWSNLVKHAVPFQDNWFGYNTGLGIVAWIPASARLSLQKLWFKRTVSFTVNKTLKWLSTLPGFMENHSGGRIIQCSVRPSSVLPFQWRCRIRSPSPSGPPPPPLSPQYLSEDNSAL